MSSDDANDETMTTIVLRDQAGTTYAVPLAVLEGYALAPEHADALTVASPDDQEEVQGFAFMTGISSFELVGTTSFTSPTVLQSSLQNPQHAFAKPEMMGDPA